MLATSTNPSDWTVRNSRTEFSLYGVAYGNNTFVVVGDVGVALQSDPLPVLRLGLQAVGRRADRSFALSATRAVGQTWEIESSTNLVDWVWLTQFQSSNATMPFIDLGARYFSRRSYRGQWW